MKLDHIKSVLVVVSSKAMVFDLSAFRNFITYRYQQAAVFFISTSGDPIGVAAPKKVDLIIDFSEPGVRQGLFFSIQMRARGRVVIGRKTGGFFSRKSYDKLYDEKSDLELPIDFLARERAIQKKVLALAEIDAIQHGGVTRDLSHEIARGH